MNLTIIIPVHNEEKTLEKVLLRVDEVFKQEDYEILLVDDGSSDGTPEIITNLKNPKIKTIHHEKNHGKGRAIINALQKASGDFIAIQDADLEYDPSNLYKLYKIALEKERVIYGKRNGTEGYLLYRLGNKVMSGVCSILFGARLYDIYTCYKIIPRELMRSLELKSNSFEIEAEITAKILKRKIPIEEIPIPYVPRTKKEGKHIRLKDGLKGIWMLIKTRLS